MSDTRSDEAVAERWHAEIFNEGKLETADEILSPDFVFHLPGQDVRGAAEVKELAAGFRAAFPDLRLTHEEVVSADGRVAIRWTSIGTHEGEFLGVAGTGKEITSRGMDFYHVRDGKITEAWLEWDGVGMLQQMGALPSA